MLGGLYRVREDMNAVARELDRLKRRGLVPMGKAEDFETLEGIGEVYERRLYEAGVCTWRKLAALSEDRLQEICQAPSWRKPNYAEWIAQAKRLSGQEG